MTDPETTLGRLLAEEADDGRPVDVDDRLAELDALEASVPEDPDEDLAALATLGDGTRYRLARLLDAAGEPLAVCELTPLVEVSSSAVSHALADLAEAGLVESREAGRWAYYEPTARAERLLAALDGTR